MKEMIEGLRVRVGNDSFEKALRIFSKKVQNSGKLKEYKDRMEYIKPSAKSKHSKMAAKRREAKRLSEETLKKS